MTDTAPKYKGVGGWLLLFCIILTIITPLLSFSQIVSGHASAGPMSQSHQNASIVESVLAGLLHIYGFITGCIIWSGSKKGLFYAKKFLLINLICFFIIGTIVAILCGSPDVRHKVIGSYIILIPKEIIFFTIWWFYLKNSKRVKFLYET